jgi:hypothetical protein
MPPRAKFMPDASKCGVVFGFKGANPNALHIPLYVAVRLGSTCVRRVTE